MEQAVCLEPGLAANGAAEVYDLRETRLTSRVNIYNAAAALLAVQAFFCAAGGKNACDIERIREGLSDFIPPLHRMTPVGEINGVRFVNDSKATNIGAVIAALAGFGQDEEKEVVLIAGGRNKGGDFSELLPSLQRHVKQLICIGEAGPELAATAQDARIAQQGAADMEQAVALAFAAASSGDTVLLAPACASFDMFKSYEHRGAVFTGLVANLAVKNNP